MAFVAALGQAGAAMQRFDFEGEDNEQRCPVTCLASCEVYHLFKQIEIVYSLKAFCLNLFFEAVCLVADRASNLETIRLLKTAIEETGLPNWAEMSGPKSSSKSLEVSEVEAHLGLSGDKRA